MHAISVTPYVDIVCHTHTHYAHVTYVNIVFVPTASRSAFVMPMQFRAFWSLLQSHVQLLLFGLSTSAAGYAAAFDPALSSRRAPTVQLFVFRRASRFRAILNVTANVHARCF